MAVADTHAEDALPSAAQMATHKDAAIDIAAQNLTEDDYGGLYVDADGVCHIMLTDMADAALFDGLYVQIHSCTYTTGELYAVRDQVIEAFADSVPLQASWIIERDNEVVFGIDVTPEQAAQLDWTSSVLDAAALANLPVRFVYPWQEGFLGAPLVEEPPVVEEQTEGNVTLQPMGLNDYKTMHLGSGSYPVGLSRESPAFFL